jgi:hypothetical protein
MSHHCLLRRLRYSDAVRIFLLVDPRKAVLDVASSGSDRVAQCRGGSVMRSEIRRQQEEIDAQAQSMRELPRHHVA